MEQRFVELLYLSNAIKFTPDPGTITLRVRPHNNEICFEVIDPGIGIADHTRLFKPFAQIDSSLTRHYEGTGLGLVLVKSFAHLQGGSGSTARSAQAAPSASRCRAS